MQYINYTYERTGTLWEGQFLVVSRYIELNSVRAKMLERPH